MQYLPQQRFYHRIRNRLFLIGVCSFVLLLMWYLLSPRSAAKVQPIAEQPGSQTTAVTVATVDKTPIALGEFQRALLRNRARIYDYFYTTYGVHDSPSFWISRYGSETPISLLRALALEECVRIKLQQMLAQRQGIIDDISEAGFLQQLEQENRTRAERVQNQQPIYGPLVYTDETYFTKHFADMVTASEQQIAQDLAMSDADLEALYRRAQAQNGASYQAVWSQPFDQVKEQVRILVVQQEYARVIDKLCHDARVDIDHAIYDQTFVR